MSTGNSTSQDTGNPIEICRRRALKAAVSALCSEAGYMTAEESALETLTEMLQSYITELGRSSRGYCELAGRTEVMLSDVVMSLVDMGTEVQSIPKYAKRQAKTVCLPPAASVPTTTPKTLQAGSKKDHPPHIPDHLPPFPDSHTYIRTPTQIEPLSDYQIIREKAATQKRDVELGLTRFMAKTGDTETLFSDDPLAFPLIANKAKHLPYLDALLPKDQDLDFQDESYEISRKQKNAQKQEVETEKSNQAQQIQQAGQATAGQDTSQAGSSTLEGLDPDNQIDNPYLRPIKMPKLQKKRGKYV